MARRKKGFQELITLTDKENPNPEHVKQIRELVKNPDAEAKALLAVNEASERVFRYSAKLWSNTKAVEELYAFELAEKRKEMDYTSADRMVKMLIDQVILCQFALCRSQMTLVAKLHEGGLSFHAATYYNRTVTEHQRRFNRACLSLTKVRKLLAESEYYQQKARRARRVATKHSMDIYARLSK